MPFGKLLHYYTVDAGILFGLGSIMWQAALKSNQELRSFKKLVIVLI
jgi:hypothetical protein